MGGADVNLVHGLGDCPALVQNDQHLVRQGNVAAVGSDEVEVGVAALAGLDQAFGLLFDIGKLKAPLARKPFQQLVGGEIFATRQGKEQRLGRQHTPAIHGQAASGSVEGFGQIRSGDIGIESAHCRFSLGKDYDRWVAKIQQSHSTCHKQHTARGARSGDQARVSY